MKMGFEGTNCCNLLKRWPLRISVSLVIAFGSTLRGPQPCFPFFLDFDSGSIEGNIASFLALSHCFVETRATRKIMGSTLRTFAASQHENKPAHV
jgi:hypothetical protein